MSDVLPRCLPSHKTSHGLSHTSRENQKARRMRNPLGNRILRAFLWTSVNNSRGGTRTLDPGIMRAVPRPEDGQTEPESEA
jgi:hypothetical protein